MDEICMLKLAYKCIGQDQTVFMSALPQKARVALYRGLNNSFDDGQVNLHSLPFSMISANIAE